MGKMEGMGVATLRDHYTAIVANGHLVVLIIARTWTGEFALSLGWFRIDQAAARVFHLCDWIDSFFIDSLGQFV